MNKDVWYGISIYLLHKPESFIFSCTKPTIEQRRLLKEDTEKKRAVYTSMKMNDLQSLLVDYKLPKSGKKDDLVQRLIDYDCLTRWGDYDNVE